MFHQEFFKQKKDITFECMKKQESNIVYRFWFC